MRNWIWGTLAAASVLAAGSVASADDDTVRLGGPSAVQGNAETEWVRGGGRGGGGHGGHGGFHGGHGGFHGGHGGWHGGYGGYYGGGFYGYGYGRGYYGGYYRPYYYANYFRPYYYPGLYYAYAPYYYSSGYDYPATYYDSYDTGVAPTTPYYYPTAQSYYPRGEVLAAPPATTQRVQSYYPIRGEVLAAPPATTQKFQVPLPQRATPKMPPAGDGTFPYDGGPRSPIPMPVAPDRNVIPIDGKLVSLPTGSVSVPITHVPVSTATTPRVAYPAYGDEPLPPAPRKAIR
jgi:hypothetical protein